MSDDYNDITLEGSFATWTMKMEGAILGTYSGIFKFKCFLTPTQAIAANREYRAILGEFPILVPEYESNLAYALSQLKHRIVSAPPFWSSSIQSSGLEGDIPDNNVLMAVLDAALRSELKFKEKLLEKKNELAAKARAAAEKLADDASSDNSVVLPE